MKINYPPLSEKEFLSKYLQFCNLLLSTEQQLTDSEIKLVIEFLLLPDDKFAYQRFGSLAKRKVIESAAQQDWELTKININNKIYALRNKGFLRKDIDKVLYMPEHITKAFAKFRKDKTFEINVILNANEENRSDTGENIRDNEDRAGDSK